MTSITEGSDVFQRWNASTILLSYLIAITGSFCTIQLMEKWRSAMNPKSKLWLLILSSLSLGGSGIWSMHFTGMNALELTLEDNSVLSVDFELGLTVLSFICATLGVFVGLKIASTDPFFLEVEQENRKTLLVKNLESTNMSDLVNKEKVAKRIRLVALFGRPTRIAGGGLFAAIGVLGMHYLGMMAQRMHANMTLNTGLVVLSVAIAYITATAAFWIIFRALTFFQDSELLRVGSALIMGVAVCGTHYSGMGAASYTYATKEGGGLIVKGSQAAVLSSHGSLLFCYWVMTWSVASSVRNITSITSARSNNRTNGSTGTGQRIKVASTRSNRSIRSVEEG